MKEFSVVVQWFNGDFYEYVTSFSSNDVTVDDVELFIENSRQRFIKIGEDLVNLDNVLTVNVSEVDN